MYSDPQTQSCTKWTMDPLTEENTHNETAEKHSAGKHEVQEALHRPAAFHQLPMSHTSECMQGHSECMQCHSECMQCRSECMQCRSECMQCHSECMQCRSEDVCSFCSLTKAVNGKCRLQHQAPDTPEACTDTVWTVAVTADVCVCKTSTGRGSDIPRCMHRNSEHCYSRSLTCMMNSMMAERQSSKASGGV